LGSIGAEILRARLRPATAVSFADFAVRQFVPTLARRLVLDYSEKLWGLPAHELSPEVATRRLQGMTFRSLIAERIVPWRKAAHIDGEFLYPRSGFGRIEERLVEHLPAAHPTWSLHDLSLFGATVGCATAANRYHGSQISLAVIAGQPYVIVADSYNGRNGAFTLNIAPPP
jgi:protoporphyrinogen oxidase